MTIAEAEGWSVIPLYENFEGRLRTLVAARAVDGVVGKFISASWLQGLPHPIPCVHLGSAPLSGVTSVVPDTQALGLQAGEHLRACGHTQLMWYSVRRVEGVIDGIECHSSPGRVVEARTLEACRSHLESHPRMGVFCLTDYHARQLVTLCQRMKKHIPDEVGVLGIGDRFWDGVIAGLGISSIPIPHRQMGERAAEQLRAAFDGHAQACLALKPGLVRIRDSTRLADQGHGLVLQVRGWLEDRLEDPPLMEELARRVGMSRRGFERAFKESAGVSPYEYLLQLRTAEACRLLKETAWTVGRIGTEIGMPDPSRFSAFLKKRTGKSPSAWKNMPA